MIMKLESRDAGKEIKKAFKMYDDDDNSTIEHQNLINAAQALNITITMEEVNEMMAVGDFKHQGCVDLEDFMKLMEIGGQNKKKGESPEVKSEEIMQEINI